MPRAWTVLVLADRGVYARWLLRRLTRPGWHPLLRLNIGETFRPQGHVCGVSLQTVMPEPGTAWQGPGIALQGRHRQLHGALLVFGEAESTDPSLILTDLPPEARTPAGLACGPGWSNKACRSPNGRAGSGNTPR